MADRYFVETSIAEEGGCPERVWLSGAEAHHLIHVMRAKPGTRVVLFDGSGAEFPARVERVGRAEIELAVLSCEQIDRELSLEIILGVALPKGGRQRWLVEKAVELGISRIVPLRTTRSVAKPAKQMLGRLRRSVIEASKQCGRNRLMEIAEPQDWQEFVAGDPGTAVRLLAHPCGNDSPCRPLAVHDVSGPVVLAIGPEGGFIDDEVSMAIAAGWRPVDLGPRILRVETAAVLLVAMVVTPGR